MKKQSIILVIAVFSYALLPSCTSKTQPDDAMQKPTEQAVVVPVNNTETTVSPEDAKAINIQNMQDAFKGETTASAKYAAYS
ncbi:MAG: hypothetical protein ABI729_02855 [Chitinophagales bacterium]